MAVDSASILTSYYIFKNQPDKALETAISAQPTVIMLDLVMPGVNGLTMVKFFKSS